MNFLQELHKAEKSKDYSAYIKIANKFLSEHADKYPPKIIEITKSRRDIYIKKRSKIRGKIDILSEILQHASNAELRMLQKCCPMAKKFINNQEKKDKAISASAKHDALITDALITKNKDLSISREEKSSSNVAINYFQIQLSSTFRVTPLNVKSTKTSQLGISELISLDNEFMPIVLIERDTESLKIKKLHWIAFPSALRGGYHYAELVDKYAELRPIDAYLNFTQEMLEEKREIKIQSIVMQSDNYNIGIGYCNEQFRKWLTEVHEINVFKACTTEPNSDAIYLPQKSYPTLTSILNGINKTNEGSTVYSADILIVNESDCTPMYKISAAFAVDISKKNIQQDPLAYPYVYLKTKTTSSKKALHNNPLCILQANNRAPLALHPLHNPTRSGVKNIAKSLKPSELKDIAIASKIENPNSISEEYILSIAHQKNVQIKKIIFIIDKHNEKEVKSRFQEVSEKWSLPFEPEYVMDLKDVFLLLDNCPCLLIMSPYIYMQNPYTLQLLSENLRKYSSFSSGCILNHLQTASKKEIYDNISAGMYLSINQYAQTGRVTLEAKNLTLSLLPTDIKVLSNHYDFSLFDTDILVSEIRDFGNTEDISLILSHACSRQSARGKHNVCTTRICASYIKSPTLNMSIMLDRENSRYIIDNLNHINDTTTNVVELLS